MRAVLASAAVFFEPGKKALNDLMLWHHYQDNPSQAKPCVWQSVHQSWFIHAYAAQKAAPYRRQTVFAPDKAAWRRLATSSAPV